MLPSLIHIIYASSASPGFDRRELEMLVQQANVSNARMEITGTLLVADGCFMQVLEGRAERVAELYGKIERDPRHHHVSKIICEPIPRRHFEEWSVGFVDVSPEEISMLAGVKLNNLLTQQQVRACAQSGRAMKLVAAFRSGSWRHKLSSGHMVEAF
jgi:hypothetical protein